MTNTQQQAMTVVWNASQSGVPDDMGIARDTLDALVAAGYLATWDEPTGIFYRTTEAGRKQAGLRTN